MTEMVKCPKCGASISDLQPDSRFCTECGEPLPSGTRVTTVLKCPKCGSSLSSLRADSRYCPECGETLPSGTREEFQHSAPILAGLAAGIVLGYPISYFLQPGALRQKLSLGGYIRHMGEVMDDPDLRVTALSVWIVCIVIFPLIARFVARRTGPGLTAP